MTAKFCSTPQSSDFIASFRDLVYFSINLKHAFMLISAVLLLFYHLSIQVNIMFKMIDVLDQNLVQNFTTSLNSATELDELFGQSLLDLSEIELQNVIAQFFAQKDALAKAKALDISDEAIAQLQTGENLTQTTSLTQASKIIALCLAEEIDAFAQVEVSDISVDYFV